MVDIFDISKTSSVSDIQKVYGCFLINQNIEHADLIERGSKTKYLTYTLERKHGFQVGQNITIDKYMKSYLGNPPLQKSYRHVQFSLVGTSIESRMFVKDVLKEK